LKRSVLFVWVTAEEKGLLGSRYFAARPTVPAESMVADINTDQFLPIIPLTVLTAYGLAESDLGDRLRRVMAGSGVKVRTDPEPLRNIFIRSDQYSFIRVGIPSLMLAVGADPGSAEDKILATWRTERYHAPSDDTNQPVDLAAAGKFEDMMLALTTEVANDPQRPSWHRNSFFRRFAAAPERAGAAP
jgi:Zn-dependent M28 family amino/carboxypeptidase